MDYSRPELADRLAAEYVAGTLRGGARRRLERLLPAHPLLREAVRQWQDRLVPLAASIAPIEPPASLWARIDVRTGGAPASGSTAAPASPAGGRAGGWWMQLAFWRGFSALASVAAVALAVVLAMPQPAQPPVVVVLAATGGTSEGVGTFVASVSSDGRALVTKPIVNVNLEAGRAFELWSVPPQGAPRSLGLISPSGTTVVQRNRRIVGAAALAVSLEPSGGSPTGAPTGPILYVGKLTS
jgi:anti-sigma-K factor RskA